MYLTRITCKEPSMVNTPTIIDLIFDNYTVTPIFMMINSTTSFKDLLATKRILFLLRLILCLVSHEMLYFATKKSSAFTFQTRDNSVVFASQIKIDTNDMRFVAIRNLSTVVKSKYVPNNKIIW